MSRILRRFFLVLPTLLAAPASGGDWSLGANLSVSAVQSGRTSGSSTVLALPSNVLTYQPALRVSYGVSRHANDVGFEAGALVIDEAGSTLSLLVASLSYQHAFAAASVSGLFANGGVGSCRGGANPSKTTSQRRLGVGTASLARSWSLRVGEVGLPGPDDFWAPGLLL